MPIGIGIGLSPLVRNCSVLNLFPVPSLQSFASDLTVIEVSGSYYFKALVGDNLLITGYDFPVGWVKGWPFKSAATVDVFGLAGVPVISLLNSNFDYGNQYFTKQVVQVVNEAGIEVSEGFVSAIVAYSAPLTDANLTVANTYFGVPTELTAAMRYVNPATANDLGTGLKASPWKTLYKANASATISDLIYRLTGSLAESSGSNYLTTNKTLTYKGIGLSKVISLATNRIIHLISENPNFTGLIFDSENNSDDNITIYGANNKVSIFDKCLFTNFKVYSINGAVAVAAITVKNSIILGKPAATYAAQWLKINGPLLDNNLFTNISIQIGADGVVSNNKISANDKTETFIVYTSDTVFKGNKINYKYNAISQGLEFASQKTIEVKFCQFTHTPTGVVSSSVKFTNAKNVTTNPINLIVTDSLFSSADTINSTDSYFISLLSDHITIDRNILISKSVSAFYNISAQGLAANIRNNYTKSNSLAGSQLILGGENSNVDKTNGSIVSGNRVIGYKLETPLATGSTHALFISSGINIKTAYNFVSHSAIGLVVKTGLQRAYTSEGVYGNLIKDCTAQLWVRGVSGLNIFNNTIIHTENTYTQGLSYCIVCDENSAAAGDQFCENVIIKNNIIVSMRATGLLVFFDAHAAANGCTTDYNIYYTSVAKPFSINSVYYSFAEWQALGHDAHSIMLTSAAQAKALFTDFDNGDYSLVVGSAAIGTGATLAGYTTLLDSDSTWGSESTTPIILTKENTSLCIGAFTT